MSHTVPRIGVLAVVLILSAGCAGPTSSGLASPSSPAPRPSRTTAPASASVAASPSSSAASALVGEWARENRCEEIVARLTEAGLDASILDNAAAFVPGASSGADIADPESPCAGAVPLRHSHFFTLDGRFGSRDENGAQVDDGTYRVEDDRTFVVSKEFPDVTFHFVVDGNTIMFEPVIPDCVPECFEATWAVTVAYEGLPWARVPGS